MGNSSPAPPKETGVISFDTLRYLHHEEVRSKVWRHSDMMEQEYTEDLRKVLHELALGEKACSTSLIDEVEREQWKLSNLDMREFASTLTQIMDRMELNLQKKVLEVYTLTGQVAKAEAIKSKGVVAKSHLEFKNPTINSTSIDMMRLNLALLRELATLVINCTEISITESPHAIITRYAYAFDNAEATKKQLMDRALASLSPVPSVEAITEWSNYAKKTL